MISHCQILSTLENYSIIIRAVNGAWFNNDLNMHKENELIYFTSGDGSITIGHNEIAFESGDIFLTSRNCIQSYNDNGSTITSAIVVQFSSDCFGYNFLFLPECTSISSLLQKAKQGLRFNGKARTILQILIYKLKQANGIEKLILLLQCLQSMCETDECKPLSGRAIYNSYPKNENWIDKLFRFTEKNFQTPITLHQAASAVCMSVPSFCHYFKQYTQKTYNDYLNEVRINFACRQLRETDDAVSVIGYKSGYNTTTHFHRKFAKLKSTTPLQYRRSYRLSPYTINLKVI